MVLTASNLPEYIEFATARVLEPASLWTSSNYTGKQKIQFRIFPEGIYYDKKNDQPRTPKINSLFLLSTELAGVVVKEEARPSELIFKKSGFVSPHGLEPWTH
jgi:site-specific DNA recombinase